MEEGADAPPSRSKFERPSSPAISVESITETRIARLRSLDRSSQPDPLDLAECSPGHCRSNRIYALEQRLAALKASGHNVHVQYPLEQVMHWHFVAIISRKLCRKRAQGGWRC